MNWDELAPIVERILYTVSILEIVVVAVVEAIKISTEPDSHGW